MIQMKIKTNNPFIDKISTYRYETECGALRKVKINKFAQFKSTTSDEFQKQILLGEINSPELVYCLERNLI